jgi:CMP-N,N'-diacetyllegionaminic acid synthase
MAADEKVLAVIPARGGSKGVPGKNVRALAGKPLIAWTIETALAARGCFHRIVVSTDDPAIAALARRYGAEAPFLRPAELATDTSPMLPALQHAVRFVEDSDAIRLDWIMLLQPTAPFRSPEDIAAALALARAGGADSIISVERVHAHHPILMKKIVDGRLEPYCVPEREGTRRQDYDPPAYMRNGAIYLTRRDVLLERNSIWGETIKPYVMPEERSVSIDSERDFLMAEAIAAARAGRRTSAA